MPVEVMAARGRDALRFGPMRPVGLTDPKTGRRAYAVLQLRKENAAGDMYNLVGFQTNLKFGEQRRVFGMIPALANAEYLRYGVMHRNAYIDAPRSIDMFFRAKKNGRVFIAGQLSGVEGYVESIASGKAAAMHLLRLLGRQRADAAAVRNSHRRSVAVCRGGKRGLSTDECELRTASAVRSADKG